MPANKLNRMAVAVLAATVTTAAIAAPAHNARINETVTITPARTITPQEESAISSAANRVLRHVAQARADIHNDDADAAKASLKKVDTLLNIIEAALPTAAVKDRIWVAKKHLEYEDSEEVLPEMVPIYSSLDELVDLIPVETAKHHIDKARQHLKSNDKRKAAKELEAADASLVYTEIDLPLSFTRDQVAAATSALDSGDMDAADTALKSMENSVVIISAGVDEPYTAAQSSVWSATRDYAAGAYDKARAEVKEAARDLERAAGTADKRTGAEIDKLLAQAKALDTKIETRSADAATELNHLWQHTQALSQRSIEYMSAGLSRMGDNSDVKSDLIEAKLHVANARIDLFTARDPDDARLELDQGVAYLDKAAHAAGESRQSEVRSLQSDAKRLAGNLAKDVPDDSAQYAQLETKLHRLIQSL
jgi:hypothetical protein